MLKNTRKVRCQYMRDETLMIMINKGGKMYAMGINMNETFPKNLYHLLALLFRTLRKKWSVPYAADIRREVDGSILSITFAKREITAREVAFNKYG